MNTTDFNNNSKKIKLNMHRQKHKFRNFKLKTIKNTHQKTMFNNNFVKEIKIQINNTKINLKNNEKNKKINLKNNEKNKNNYVINWQDFNKRLTTTTLIKLKLLCKHK